MSSYKLDLDSTQVILFRNTCASRDNGKDNEAKFMAIA